MAVADSAPPAWLESYVAPIDSRISAQVGKGTHSLERAVAEALSGGKRIRAVLAMLWCEAVSGDSTPAIPVATAYEFAHAAALVQDDIVDRSDYRRGEESIVRKYGLRTAILASNILLAHVPREVSAYGTMGPDGGKRLSKLFELLGDSYAASVLGEFLDLELTEKGSAEEGDYEYMIKLKTGALIGASSASGVVVGDAQDDGQMTDAAYRFGESLGMAYQVQDDLLDIVGEESVLGKPVFADIRAGKKNLVLIHTMQNCTPDERKFLSSLPAVEGGVLGEVEMGRARELFVRYESVEYARRMAERYSDRAKEILDRLQPGVVRDRLYELCDFITGRKY